MASALQEVAWETCLIEPRSDRALEAYARRKVGIPHPVVRYLTPVPWLARAMIDLHPEYGLLVHLDHTVADLLALVVSQENSCRFCYAAVRAMLLGQGMSEARIQRIEHDLTRSDLPARTVAAIAFGRSQSRRGPAAAREAREALRAAGVSDAEMREIAFAVGNTDFSNRVCTITAISPRMMERLPEHPLMRLLLPLMSRMMAKRRYRGHDAPAEGAGAHPYASLVAACAGSPIAPALRRAIEEMWASPYLSQRCKLLMMAVVARGLGCAGCAAEIGAALRQEGLDDMAQAQVLTHLDGPELDSIERLLVRFARETIWYEPESLQRRARALQAELGAEQFLEAVGVAALANGLCRMGAMVAADA
jgi:AhpD family alkylhydroperoxidase